MMFDACIMNPPYDRGLGDKFLVKTAEIVRHIVSIQPLAGMLYSRKNKNLLEVLKKCDVEIQNLDDSEKIFDAGIGQLLGIYDVKCSTNPKFLLNGKDVADIDALRWYSDDEHISAFNDIVKELYENDNLKIHIQNIKQNPNPEHKYVVKIAGIRGHKGADDFLSIVSNNEKFNQQKCMVNMKS